MEKCKMLLLVACSIVLISKTSVAGVGTGDYTNAEDAVLFSKIMSDAGVPVPNERHFQAAKIICEGETPVCKIFKNKREFDLSYHLSSEVVSSFIRAGLTPDNNKNKLQLANVVCSFENELKCQVLFPIFYSM